MSTEPSEDSGFLAELKRRKVFRVAAVYAGVGFVVVQVANNFFPALHLPAWTTTLVAVLVLLGFPIALVLAWAFDITPDGVRRTPPAATGKPRASVSQRIAAAGGAVVLAIAGGAFLLVGSPARDDADADREVTIVVLPFVNVSADADNEYLSDGMAEDIRGRLSRLAGLRVISRTSAMTFKGTDRTARDIARELGVTHLLEGSVMRSGDRLRIQAQLIDARADRTEWSESFDRGVQDVFAIQTEIAGQIAEALRIRLTSSDRSRLGRAQTTNLAAYELYLRALQLLRAQAPGPAERNATVVGATTLLRQSIELDPDYALPHAALAWAYENHPDLKPGAQRDSSRAIAERVVRMAPDLPDGYAELGWFYINMGQTERAGEQFRLGLERDANHEFALAGMRTWEARNGRYLEALRLGHRTIQVAPTDPAAYDAVARIYAAVGDFAAAETWFRRAWLEVGRNPAIALCEIADIARHRGDIEAARTAYAALVALDNLGGFSLECAAFLALAFGDVEGARALTARGARSRWGDGVPRLTLARIALHDGDTIRADALMREFEQQVHEQWGAFCEERCANAVRARSHALRRRPAEAIDLLRRAFETDRELLWYPAAADPFLFGLADDPRFRALIAEVRTRLDRERERVHRELGS
jgi:adenylate cyclase